MPFIPGNITDICQQFPTIMTCQPSVLAFMVFVLRNFDQSYDKDYSDHNYEHIEEEYDFIIVGGGTAGCVVANRLSEIGDWKILLLEVGGEEPRVTNVPGFYSYLTGSNIDWNYKTQPEPVICHDIEDNTCVFFRGKVLGGSSAINAMIYTRGNRKDYDYWESLGNNGWSYEDVLPYFLKSEDNKIYLNNTFHSVGGLLTVDKYPYVDKKKRDVVLNAWKDLGYNEVDYNGYNQLGVAKQQSVNINGARLSTNGAFIRPIRGKRPNLTIKINALVTRILINPSTKEAYGVEYSDNGNKNEFKQVIARKEVIVSAGTIESPKLLMLSGIGHEEELEKNRINVVQSLAVGDNLQDHVFVMSTMGIWNDVNLTEFNITDVKNDLILWQNSHTGPLSNIGITPLVIFDTVLNNINNSLPDVQYFHLSSNINDIELTDSLYGIPSYIPVAYYDGIGVGPILLHPKARGTIRLNNGDPLWSQPILRFNFLTDKEDRDILITACLKIKNLFDTYSFTKYGFKLRKPAIHCKDFEFDSREYYNCIVKMYSKPSYHAVGSCKMGPDNDTKAVVNPNLQVHGIQKLRVIDSSIMPTLPSGNTMASTVMIAEKGSDLIKEFWLRN